MLSREKRGKPSENGAKTLSQTGIEGFRAIFSGTNAFCHRKL
jgi:hypothetical protein